MRIKRSLIRVVAIIIIFFLFMTWFYPYSNYSIHKSYYYKPDPVMVDGYLKDLKEFKTIFEKDLEHEFGEVGIVDLTVDRTQYVLPILEQDWLVSKDTVRISKRDLEDMLFRVDNVKETLLDLIVREDFTMEQRDFLVSVIRMISYLEDQLLEIKEGSGASRLTLKNRIYNLHGDFMSTFMMYRNFYDVNKDL